MHDHRLRRRRRRVASAFGVQVILALVFAMVATAGPAAAGPATSASSPGAAPAKAAPLKSGGQRPEVQTAVKHDTSPALRTLRAANTATASPKASEARTHAVPHNVVKSGAKAGSAAVQSSVVTNSMPSLGQNFEGISNVNGVFPPDTQGDVGPNHYVQMVNLSFAVWDKQGNKLLGPLPNTALWQGFGGDCQTFNRGDPITQYDESADRWFMSQLAFPSLNGPFHQCIAVSQTPDPTGAWFRYDFLFSQDTVNDYPKFGIWPDAYYMTANTFHMPDETYTGVGALAFEREKMLTGQSARVVSFHVGTQFGSLLPSDAEGGALGFNPPAGAPNPFVMFDDDAFGVSPTDRILMWDFHVDWGDPTSSTFGNNGNPNRFLETAPFDSNLCNFDRNCIPQPGTPIRLDTLADRLMYRAAYRNFGDHQGIALTQSVDTNGADHAGIRWYQLSNPGSGWSLAQQGTYAPDSDNRWMGSVAMDASEDLAVGFSVSSSSTFPSIRVAGRLAGDPAGQLAQGEQTLVTGSGVQTDNRSRWGDYSAMQVDPTDGCTFWFTSEYMATTSLSGWQTRIGSFKFPSCTAGPHGDITGTVTDAGTHKPISGATVTSGPVTTTTDDQGKYQMTLPVGSFDLTFSAFGYISKTINGVQVTDGGTTTVDAALTARPTAHVTGTVTDGSGHGWPLYTRIDIDGRPGGAIFTDPVTGHFSVDLPQNDTYSFTLTATLPGYQVVTEDVVVGTADVTHNVAIPVQPSCTAAGYQINQHPVFSEPFSGATFPPGWTVKDNIGQGHVWRINDPEGRANNTGGTGNFADINSDFFGSGNTQNTELISPPVDLSGVANPILRFHTDYTASPSFPQVGDVDLSTDGGSTWSNVWHHTGDSVSGPSLQTVAIPQVAGQSAVQVRYHFTSTFGFWWLVDDVTLASPDTCDPTPGGLVAGNVNDANTSDGLNGATVTSGDKPAEKATTAATPDDPNVGDGFYQMFSSLTGSHSFTATKSHYGPVSQAVNVAADSATRADFTLKAPRLQIDPQSVARSVVLGATTTGSTKITNTGTAPADVKLNERTGTFQIATLRGSPLRLVHAGEEGDGEGFTPKFLGEGGDGPGVDAGPPLDPTWSGIAPLPVNVMDNSVGFIDGKAYSVGGRDSSLVVNARGFVYDPDTNAWSALPNMPVARGKPGVAAVGGKLYVTGGWDTAGNPVARTDVFDPSTGTWSTVSPNPHPTAAPGVAVAAGKIWFVAGCGDINCVTTTTVTSYDPATDTWSTVAPYPHNNAWTSCGGIDDRVYCAGGTDGIGTFKDTRVYDPGSDSWSGQGELPDMRLDLWASAAGAANGMLVLNGGVTNGFSTVTNQTIQFDPSQNTWSDLPNSQFPRYRAGGACGFYKVGGSSGGFNPTPDSERLSELDQCGVTDVPWLDEAPTTATLQPGESVTVAMNLSATTDKGVTQPGTLTAQLGVQNNTPYRVDPIDVTLTVIPPKGWGKAAGTVTGTDCKGNTAPLRGAQIQANGKSFTFSLSTDDNGGYAFWAPAASNPFTVIASKDGWVSQTVKVNLKANKTETANFNLHPPRC
jgi:N-acetylneuraminic acid mutarotase